MSRMLSGLAVIAIGQKKWKMKNVTHAIWSGRGCHLQKKTMQKMSCTPYCLAVAVIGKKEGKTKNVTHAICSGLDCQWAKNLR